MWKIFAIFCVLLPGGECEKKYEWPDTNYKTQEECLARATIKEDQMIEHMNLTNAQMSFHIGCEKQADEESGTKEKDGNTKIDKHNNDSQRSLNRA